MLAARLVAAGVPLEIAEVPVPTPRPDEALVAVRACGLCGTDLHVAVVGDLPVERTPITLGHEASGVIAELGTDVEGLSVGQRVALFPADWCGRCRFCLIGRPSLCDRARVYGMSRDGALAEYVSAPARTLIPLPDGIDFAEAAIVTDGVATPFHALRSRGRLRAGERVGVFGCGGLGTHAIMLARLMGASMIVAVDPNRHARDRAVSLGADLALDPGECDVAREVRAFGGLDLTLEFVGKPATVELAVRSLAKMGRAVAVGVGPGHPALPSLAAFVGREQEVMGSFGMDPADIMDLYSLIAAGRLDLSGSVSARYPLSAANDALRHLATKADGVVRVVVEP